MSTWLVFDAGSPATSAAVARGGALLGAASGASRSGPSVLQQMDRSLQQAGVRLADLDGIVVLRGPGSFTGIRIALATALGLRAAKGVPVFALSHLAALAVGAEGAGATGVYALVDALRDEWFVQEFRRTAGAWSATSAPERCPVSALAPADDLVLAHHRLQPLPPSLAGRPARPADELSSLVAVAASDGGLAGLLSEDLEPLYLRGFTPREPRR